MSGIIAERQNKLLAIYCMPDHTHLLIGLRPATALSALVHDVKIGATNMINQRGWVHGRFSWQEGFGAFSYGHSQVPAVIRYIRNQPMHHRGKSFRQEYLQFLHRFAIDHDEKYIFHEVGGGSPSESQVAETGNLSEVRAGL